MAELKTVLADDFFVNQTIEKVYDIPFLNIDLFRGYLL